MQLSVGTNHTKVQYRFHPSLISRKHDHPKAPADRKNTGAIAPDSVEQWPKTTRKTVCAAVSVAV